MITSETPYKLSEIIRDTWPNIYRPSREFKTPSEIRVINTDIINKDQWRQ